MIRFDYELLLQRINEMYGSVEAFAPKIHCTAPTLWRYLRNEKYFPRKVMIAAVEALGIADRDVCLFFFKRVESET